MRSVVRTGAVVATLILGAALAQPALAEREPGATSADSCPSVDLASEVSLAGVQGTTFSGTYLGDMVLGSPTGSSPIVTFWDVDRAYAGGPLPEDLQFTTPECRWANLTPGVRYLFTTAAMDIAQIPDPDAGPAGRPTVADSLAWELGGNGAVRLAPFDTYDPDDYSAEVRSVATLEDALAAVAPGAGDGADPAPPVRIDRACTNQPNPIFEDVQGTTFLGRYIGDERLAAGSGLANTRVYWSVERVFAGGPLPEILLLRTSACGPVTLKPGKRYIFTTSEILRPSISDSMAWQVKKQDRVVARPFSSIDMRFYRDFMPDVREMMRNMESIAEVLAAVAPSHSEGEPPMRAADRTPG